MKMFGLELFQAPVTLQHVRDIEFFEGPLISEFRAGDQTYVLSWRDCDDEFHRWLAIPVTQDDLGAYETRTISLLELYRRGLQGYAYLIDARGNGEFARWMQVRASDLPKTYYPRATAYHDDILKAK